MNVERQAFASFTEMEIMKDRLHDIFKMMLSQTDDMNETASQLIRRVAGVYAIELQQEAEIPLAFLDDVLDDLESELLVIYRKTTYGFWSLQEYREAKLSPSAAK